MFLDFRKGIKSYLRLNNMTYQDVAEKANISVGTIKCFMCGANNSRRIAEKIVDALNLEMIYFEGKYYLKGKI